MNRNWISLSLAVPLFFTGAVVRSSDPVGIYAIIDKVVLEPSAEAPERVQIWGAFSLNTGPGMGDTYLPPARGYLYYSADPNQVKASRVEWLDMQKLSGKDECIGFASRYMPTGTVRGGCQEPAKPDVYPVSMGLTKFRSDTGYQPIADLLGMPAPRSPEDGSSAVEAGSVKVSVRNSLTTEHPGAIYFFDLLSSSGESLESAEVTPGDTSTTWVPEVHVEAGLQYSWTVTAIDGDWKSTTASACFTLPFLRGDANGDKAVDLSDAVFDLNYLFSGGSDPRPLISGDMDANGLLELTDPVYLLMYLFQGGKAPPPPFPEPGIVPTGP